MSKAKLLPYFAEALHAGVLEASPEQHADMASWFAQHLAGGIELEREVLTLTSILGGAAIPHRVLKGFASAYLDYPKPGLRSFGDLDVVVPGTQIAQALRVLDREGFRRQGAERRPGFDRRFEKSITLLSPRGIEIDLHRTLISGPFGYCFEPDELFDSGEEFVVGARTLTALGREERFVHACLSATISDPEPRIRPGVDVLVALQHPQLDADRVLRVAYRWGMAVLVSRAIDHSVRWLGVDLDHPLRDWARSYLPSRRELFRIGCYVGPSRSHTRKAFGSFVEIHGITGRAAFLAAMISPDPAAVGTPLLQKTQRAIQAVLPGRAS